MLATILASIFCHGGNGATTPSRIRWFDGTWDDSGAPRGRLLSENNRWFGDRVFTGVTYEWEMPPTDPEDFRIVEGRKIKRNRLLRGYESRETVGRDGKTPLVAVFDFKRPCEFTEIDVIARHCTNATGFVEFSTDRMEWGGRRDFTATAAITRVRFAVPQRGRYMRISFQATPDAIDDWKVIGRRGYTYLDKVVAWGDAEVSAEYPEVILPIPCGDLLAFTNVASGVVSILPMPIPRLGCKPSGATPANFPVTMARNETESRYFAIVNGTDEKRVLALSASDFGEGVRAELLIGGVTHLFPPKRKLTSEEMMLLFTENDTTQGAAEDLEVHPFFFAHALPKENFLRRYVANPAQVSGFPNAVPLEPGEGCVVMLRLTTNGTAPGRREGIVRAADAALTIPLTIVDLTLPPQSMWIYAYEPFSQQYPFESEARVRRDAERYAEIGATTTMRLPEPETKERIFFDIVPQASVGSLSWCDREIFKRIWDGKYDSLTEKEREKIVSDARAFQARGRALGVKDDRLFAFLPDEPREVNARGDMALARLLKGSVPSLLLHSNPAFWNPSPGGLSAPDVIAAALLPEYNEFIDISCPVKWFAVPGSTHKVKKTAPETPTDERYATVEALMKGLWLHPRRVNAMYNAPAVLTGREMLYACLRNGFNGFSYYCYCHPGIDVWEFNQWYVIDMTYQAVMPLEEDVAITALYETLREAAEDARLFDALKEAGKDGTIADILKRSKGAWDRTGWHWKHHQKANPNGEDILALRETALLAFAGEDGENVPSVNWDEAYLEGSLGRECPFFEPDEEMVFTLRLKRAKGTIPPDTYFVDWVRTGDDGVEEKGRAPLPADDEPLMIRAKSDKPGFVRIVANVVTADGERVKSKIPWEKRVFFEGGAAVAPETLKPGTEPDDYDAFWESQMTRLDAVPIKAEFAPTNCADTAVRLYAVRIDCAGPRPVTGWLTIPSDASPEKRYPVEVNFRGASMDDQPAPKGGPHDRIRFMSNGHGFDLGRGPEYVKEFFAGICKPGGIYGFDNESNRKRDDSYWLGMALRAIRAAQWAATLPEWDGKSLELTGGSQGGWQSLMAAARCHRVTRITTGITWGCDWTGQAEYKRIRSRYRPGCWYPDMAYFDAVFAAKRVTCPVSIDSAGLGDYVSPPSSLAVLYNCLSVPKKIVWLQGKTHGFTPPNVAKWVVDGSYGR